jgi:hypothetical protein
MLRASRTAVLTLLASLALLLGVGSVAAATTTTIDFETLTGPSTFCPPALSPLNIGVATFTGGTVLTAATNLPADQTSVYGTLSTCSSTGYSNTLTITFARPVSDFSVLVVNGNTVTVSYTVADDAGGSVTKSLVANLPAPGGADTFSLPDDGITSVTIGLTTPAGFYDFFIDDVQFTAFPITTAECKNGGWEAYGVFKNQGDCVSYVATHGKNEPGQNVPGAP